MVLVPEPLRVGREAFVQPDVLPRGEREAVPVPLVGQLVHDHVDRRRADRRRSRSRRSAASGSRARTRGPGSRRRGRRRPRTDSRRTGSARKSRISGCIANEASTCTPIGVGVSAAVPTIQSLPLGALPAGAPGTVQPSIVSPSFSNDVVPVPVETTMSSTKTPCFWKRSSLAYRWRRRRPCPRRPTGRRSTARTRRCVPSGRSTRRSCRLACRCRRPGPSGSARGTGAARARTGRRSLCRCSCGRSGRGGSSNRPSRPCAPRRRGSPSSSRCHG